MIYRIFDFKEQIEFYEHFKNAHNFGDGDQTDDLHPVFDLILKDLTNKTGLSLEISAARIVHSQSDLDAHDWHNDAQNPEDTGTSYSLLIYCNDMDKENGGLLEFQHEILIPQRGMGVLINNKNPLSLHRSTKMKTLVERKFFKLTFKDC
jgi:hypothetical protein